MKKRRVGLKSIFKLVIVIAVVLAIGGTTISYALIDETNSVHIRASEIEDATLIIGTHLIYLGSMNDQIYEAAMKSAEESNQYNRYYKSEIAGGVWYDITDAGALADITSAGIVVENRVIEELFMTHHTKSDGVTYDLRNGSAVGIFDINNPYDLSGLSELEPIKLQYDTLVQTEDPSDTMERDILYIKEIYQFNRKTARTNEIDTQINALQGYYNILVRDEAEEAMSEKVLAVMEKLDAARRVEVLGPLNETHLQKMSQVIGREFTYLAGEITGVYSAAQERVKDADAAAQAARDKVYAGAVFDENTTEEAREYVEMLASQAAEEAREAVLSADRDVVENFVPNSELISAVGESMSNVQESYTNYSSKMLAEGTTVLSRAEYRFSMELISNAQAGNYSGCDIAVDKLLYLDRVNNGTIQEEAEERNFIAGELLQEISNNYRSSLGSGVGEKYQTLASTAAASTRKNVLKNQLSETEIVRNELQFIMQAYIDRMAPEAATEYISDCVDKIDEYRNVVKSDAYQTYAESSVDSHLEWLTKTLKNLQDLMGGNALDDLNLQKDELQTEMMTALDNNKLDQAKKIETQIEAIDKQISDTENYLNSVLNSEFASESEKALAAAQLGDGSALAALQDIKEEAIESIKNGNLDGIENALEGIGALASAQPEGAMGALKDIYGELSNQELMNGSSSKLDDLLNQVEDLAVNQIASVSDELTEDDLATLIVAFVNENMDGDLDESDYEDSDSNALDRWGEGNSNDQGTDSTGTGSGAGVGSGTGSEGSGSGSGTGSEGSGSGAGVGSGTGSEGSGSGSGAGSGTGSGSGSGVGSGVGSEGSGSGSGVGSGTGSGSGVGSGTGSEGSGSGSGTGSEGSGSGSGAGSGTGSGTGSEGSGSGSGTGSEGSGSGTGSGSGSGVGIGSGTSGDSSSSDDLSSDNLSGRSSKLNEVMKNLNDEQMSTILAGLSMYAEQTNAKAMKETLKIYGKNVSMDGNDYVYQQLGYELSEFLPTDKLARIIGYRYIFNDSQKRVTLQRGSQYYQFEAFSSSVKKGADFVEMDKAAGFQGVIYIPRDIAQEYFALTTSNLYKTSYGVILTPEMNDLALEFFDYLLDAQEDF